MSISIDAKELVPGDIVLIQSGDKSSANVGLVQQRDMIVDESALLEESISVEKNAAPVGADTMLGDRFSMSFSFPMAADRTIFKSIGHCFKFENHNGHNLVITWLSKKHKGMHW